MTAAGEEPRVGVEEARARFATIIGRARRNSQPTTITNRGFPVARVVPIGTPDDSDAVVMNGMLRAAGYEPGPAGLLDALRALNAGRTEDLPY